MTPPSPTRIFHITALGNLRMLLEAGELRAKRILDQSNAGYTTIAHANIQDKRAITPVPCASFGVLHDYVPFYFGPRSPMLFALSKGKVEGFVGDQSSIIHLVSTAQSVQDALLNFAFTDGHGTVAFTEFFDDLAQLNEIDWQLMQARYWADTDEDPDRKRRRQAEFLVHERFPMELIRGIGVMNSQAKTEVEAVIKGLELTIPVAVKRNWYY